MAAHRLGDGGEVRAVELHAERAHLRIALFQLDQAELLIDEDDDGQTEAKITRGREFAKEHFKPRIADEGNDGTVRLGQGTAQRE